jgi:hypothetical protein
MGRREEDAREARALREDEIRERMARDADIMRGVGGVLGVDDLRAYGEELAWAAVGDQWEPISPEEADRNAALNRMQEEAEDEEIFIEAEKEYWRMVAEERAEGLDYDDRDHYDKEVGT